MIDDTEDETRTIEIPERTAQIIAARLSWTEFETVDEYVTFALGQLLREIDRHDDPSAPAGSDGETADVDSRHTDEAVADRLESLGYL
ncbi:MAG: hypothetical protein ACQEQJ_00155 [Halobacteriota archaeon]